MLNNYICGLDIGSSKISAVVVEVKKKRISNIFFESMPSRGIQRGAIADSIDLIGTIGHTLKNLRNKSGINIKFIYTSISGKDILTKHIHAVIPLAERGNKIITFADMKEVNEQARILGSNLEEEIIQQIPYNYTIDSNSNILNPIGLYSHKLEVDLYLICGKLLSIQNLVRVINQAGYEIKDLFFSGLVTSNIVFSQEFNKGITIFCDIGKDITELLVFKGGMLMDIEIMPFGGDDFTLQLSEILKISPELAEDIKTTYASVGDYSQIDNVKEILVKKSNAYKPISQKSVTEILTPKARLICQSIKDAIEKTMPCNEVNNFVTSGRTVLLEGFLEMLENNLGIPVRLGRINNPDILHWINKDAALLGHKYLTYLTSLGIICQALHQPRLQIMPACPSTRNPFLKAINKVKEIYQEYF